MALYVDKITAGQRQSTTDFLNPATDSSARKYTSVDSVENNSPTNSTANIEHIVNAGAGVQSLALALPAIANTALAQISATLAQLAAVQPANSSTQPAPAVSKDESDVSAIQDALAQAAATTFNSVSDPNLRAMLKRRVGNYVSDSRHAVAPIHAEDATTITVNTVVPLIETVRVDIDKNTSAVDNFYASILFNLPATSTNNILAVRVFRAEVTPQYTRPLATLSSEGIQRLQSYRGRKNEDYSAAQIRFQEAAVPNAVTNLNFFTPAGARASTPGSSSLIIPPALAGSNPSLRVQNTQVPDSMAHVDPSVLNNVNVIMNLQANPLAGFELSASVQTIQAGSNVNPGLRLGSQQQLQVMGSASVSNLILNQSNALNFYDVGVFTLDKLKSKQVGGDAQGGGMVEYEYIDESVGYGRAYKYFIVTLDVNLIQSARSQLVDAVVEVIRVPDRPSQASVTIDQTSVALAIVSDDQLIEKFEVYRYEDDVNRTGQVLATTVADKQGFSQQRTIRGIADNNFLLIGECMNGQKRGGQFIDRSVKPGFEYTYRVYAVDIFGNKSESPVEMDAFVPDLQQQYVKLTAPSLLTEVDARTGFMRITWRVEDSNVESVWLERRDVTIGQEGFVNPYTPPRVIMGNNRSVINQPSLLGEVRNQNETEVLWNGSFRPNVGKDQFLLDKTVLPDHIYQYRIYGVDRYGNQTAFVVSPPLLVVVRRFINAPTDLAAQLVYDANNQISGVNVSWTEGNLDKSAEDLIGSQADLADTSVRTLYQVQRLKQGDSRWEYFSLISGTSLFDPVMGVVGTTAPNFRPPYPDTNQTYLYRVQAVQTGAFISNFTVPVKVFTGFAVGQPLNFMLRTPPVVRSPFFIMLNWDTQDNSGVVDYWELERAAINNFAASRINSKNPSDIASIQFQPYITIFRESSRFSSKVQDADAAAASNQLITGEHYFMDTQVDFGNTYFYRIRAVSPEGVRSQWSFKGTKVTSTVFEKKYVPLLTDAEKLNLSNNQQPFFTTRVNRTIPTNTLSVSSDRSLPDSQRVNPRINMSVAVYGATE